LELLKKYDIAYVNVDEPLLPPEVHLTADFTYFHWHGKGEQPWFDYRYSKKEIDKWVPMVKEVAKNVKKVWIFQQSLSRLCALKTVCNLLEKLDLLSEEQKRYKEKIKVKQSSLRAFFD